MNYYSSSNRFTTQPEAKTQENHLREITRRWPDSQNSNGWQTNYNNFPELSKTTTNHVSSFKDHNYAPYPQLTQSSQLHVPLYSKEHLTKVQETPRIGGNGDSSLTYLNAVDGYNTRIDSPKASLKMQETVKFNTEFSNGIVHRTIKAIEDAEVISQGRNLEVELELSGLKLFDLEKKIDSCISSSRSVLNLNSRISPNVSAILSQSGSKEQLMRLQPEYTNITRGYYSISPKKSLTSNIKTSVNMTSSMSLHDITVSLSPNEREKLIALDKNLSQTKANCMLSPVALAAKQYLENNKENPSSFSDTKSNFNFEDSTRIATVKKPKALGKAVQSESSPMKVEAPESVEKGESDYLANKYQQEALGRSNRILAVTTESQKDFKKINLLPQMNEPSDYRTDCQNKWVNPVNENETRNGEETPKLQTGEISFRDDFRVEKNLFREHFEVSTDVKVPADKEPESEKIQKNETTLNKAAFISSDTGDKQKGQSSLLLQNMETVETQYSYYSEPKTSLINPEKKLLSPGASESGRINVLESLSLDNEKKKALAKTSESKEQVRERKNIEKPKEIRTRGYETQYRNQNRSYEILNRSNKTNCSENSYEKAYKLNNSNQSLKLKNYSVEAEIINGDRYITQSDCKKAKKDFEDDNSLRVESEPSLCTEVNVEREIQSFLNKFNSEETKFLAKEWLKKVIDGENDEKKSLELYLQSEKQNSKRMINSMNTSQKFIDNSAKKKEIVGQLQGSVPKKTISQNRLQKEILNDITKYESTKTTKNNNKLTRPVWNYARKKEATVTNSDAKLRSPLGKSASQKHLGSAEKETKEIAKREINSYNVINDQEEQKSSEGKGNLASGFKRKKIDSNSNSGMSEEEIKRLSDRLSDTKNVNLAKNLEYLEFLRKDVVRSINYIEKSIQDLSNTSVESETSLEARSA